MLSNPKIILRMPAEWEPHSAIWIAWPHDEISFPGRIGNVEDIIVKIISAIHKSEKVELLVLNEEMRQRAENKINLVGVDMSQVSFRIFQYMDAWMRDCGGIFVKDQNGTQKLLDWNFNSWGNKFTDLLIDAHIAKKVSEWTDTEIINGEIVLEGGAIDVNGEGVLITTEQCLLNPNRNGICTKEKYAEYFEKYLGIQKIIWLTRGLTNDHTDGHVDDIVRFVGPNKILCAYEENEKDENFKILDDNFQVLINARNLAGEAFEVTKLPMPHMCYDENKSFEAGMKAPVSYANFYIGNRVVLVPIYNDPNDAKALSIIQKCFPDREVVGIDCTDIIYGGGAIHCLTQQMPQK